MKEIYVALVLCLASCAAVETANPRVGGEFATATPVCAVMNTPGQYVGHRLHVSGLFAATPHGGEVYGRECESQTLKLRSSLSVRDDNKAAEVLRNAIRQRSSARVPVVYGGVLSRRQLFSCDEEYCFEYFLSDAQLIAAEPAEL